MYKRLNGGKNIFHEHFSNGRKFQSLRIGVPGGQNLNTASGGMLHLLMPQNLDSGIKNRNKPTKPKIRVSHI